MLNRRQVARDRLATAREDPSEALTVFLTAAEGLFRQLSQNNVNEVNVIALLERDLHRLEDVDQHYREHLKLWATTFQGHFFV